MRTIYTTATAAMIALAAQAVPSVAQMPAVATHADLKAYNVTVRRFDPNKGPASGTDFVLPVDSPDAEHACASTTANASAFSKKIENGVPLPVAFTCTKIEMR